MLKKTHLFCYKLIIIIINILFKINTELKDMKA